MKRISIALAALSLLVSAPVLAQTNEEETYNDEDSVRIDQARINDDIRTGNRSKEAYDRQHLAEDQQHLQSQYQTDRAEGVVLHDRHFVHFHRHDYSNYGY